MRKLIGSAVLAAALATTPTLAAAQRRPAARPVARAPAQRPSFGAELNWGSETDFGIGARVVFGLQSLFPKRPLDAQVGFDYFFPSAPAGTTAHYWEITGNVAYRIPHPRTATLAPYVGSGLTVAHPTASAAGVSRSETDLRLNFLGGTTFKVKGTVIPFGEARVSVGGGKDQLVITGGVRF